MAVFVAGFAVISFLIVAESVAIVVRRVNDRRNLRRIAVSRVVNFL